MSIYFKNPSLPVRWHLSPGEGHRALRSDKLISLQKDMGFSMKHLGSAQFSWQVDPCSAILPTPTLFAWRASMPMSSQDRLQPEGGYLDTG